MVTCSSAGAWNDHAKRENKESPPTPLAMTKRPMNSDVQGKLLPAQSEALFLESANGASFRRRFFLPHHDFNPACIPHR